MNSENKTLGEMLVPALEEAVQVSEQNLLEKAVEKALEVPAPVEEEKKPFLHQKASLYKGLKRNVFRIGRKEQKELKFKVDAEGRPEIHGNGGYVYIKEYGVKNEQ